MAPVGEGEGDVTALAGEELGEAEAAGGAAGSIRTDALAVRGS